MFGAGRCQKPIVECHERDRFTELLDNVQAARQLNRVGCTKRMPLQKDARMRGHFREQFDDMEGGEIGRHGRNGPLCVGQRNVALARPSCERRHDLDLRQPTRCGLSCGEKPGHARAAAFGNIAFDERAGVEIPDQSRSSRSRRSVALAGSPVTRIGVNGASRPTGAETDPRAARRLRRSARDPGAASMRRSSATG